MVSIARNFLIMLKNLEQRVIQEVGEATGDLIGNKIPNKIMKVSKNLQQKNSVTVTNEHDQEIPKERSIFPEEIQKNIDNLRSVMIV